MEGSTWFEEGGVFAKWPDWIPLDCHFSAFVVFFFPPFLLVCLDLFLFLMLQEYGSGRNFQGIGQPPLESVGGTAERDEGSYSDAVGLRNKSYPITIAVSSLEQLASSLSYTSSCLPLPPSRSYATLIRKWQHVSGLTVMA